MRKIVKDKPNKKIYKKRLCGEMIQVKAKK